MKVKSEKFFSEPDLRIPKPKPVFLPSEKGYRLELSLRCGKFPICEVVNDREVVTGSAEMLVPIRINVCDLTIHAGPANVIIELTNNDRFWRDRYTTVFYKNINEEDIEYLSRIVKGKSIIIGLRLEGIAKVEGKISEFELRLDDSQFKMGIDEFESTFLTNTGLQFFYNRKFELSTPTISNLSSKPALNELYVYLSSLQNNLEHALRHLRLSNDYLQVLTLIRPPLDNIMSLKNKGQFISDLSRELYVDKEVFKDIAPSTTGAQIAAHDIVKGLFSIFDVLFNISSKALHTKTKYPPTQGFQMNPGYCEAEFSLTLALNTTNYLLERIKLSST
jgi:hypothetical protein